MILSLLMTMLMLMAHPNFLPKSLLSNLTPQITFVLLLRANFTSFTRITSYFSFVFFRFSTLTQQKGPKKVVVKLLAILAFYILAIKGKLWKSR